MGLTLTASYSHLGSSTSTEPPAKKLRVSDNFRDCLYGVVGSEIGRLAAGDAAKWAAYDKLRAEVGASYGPKSQLPES